jgi:hypothetical protein
MDISSRAMLVTTRIRLWSGEKRDRRLSRQLCELTDAASDAVRANKSLLGLAIGPVQAAERRVRETVTELTLPWLDDGTRILKGSAFIPFTERVNAVTSSFDEAVEAFVAAYPAVKEEARRRLGSAYEESDFPCQSRLRQRFGVKLTFLPIPSGTDFRVELGAEEIAAVRRNAEEALRDTVHDAFLNLLDRLREPVAHMATRLRLMRRNGRGKVEHPFRDSLVLNVRSVVQLAPLLNLTDDPRIASLCSEIERSLTGWSPDQLRASAHLRNRVADEADAILQRMQGAF